MTPELIASAMAGGFVGFFACAAMTMSKVADHNDTHRLCTRAMKDQKARIDRALAVETPKAAHGVRKMAAILRGDA